MRFLKSQSTEILFNLIFFLSSITIVYLLDLDRHWTSMIDMDIMVVYNTLLLNSGIESQYFDQPSHTLLTINSYWYSTLNFFGLIDLVGRPEPVEFSSKVFFAVSSANFASLLP